LTTVKGLTVAGQTASTPGIELQMPPEPDANFQGSAVLRVLNSDDIVIQ